MKSIYTLLISGLLLAPLSGSAQTEEGNEIPAPEVPAPPAPPAPPTVEENKDTIKISFGKTKVLIIEEDDSKDSASDSDSLPEILPDEDGGKKRKTKGDYGHWAGFDIGVNGFLTFDNKLNLDNRMKNVELDYARSITLNLNIMEKRFRIVQDYLAITTGLGFQWNRYAFKNNYSMTYNTDSVYSVEIPTTTFEFRKNMLRATYLQVPLLLEINTGKKAKNSFHIAGGVIGQYRLGSKLKQKYTFENIDYNEKTKGHFHLSPFQVYATAQIGYGNFTLFANYGLMRVFEEGKGPQLYPFTVGVKLIDF